MTSRSHKHLEWLFIGVDGKAMERFSKEILCAHRPIEANAVYKLLRKDGKPFTDEDLEIVNNCDECYPVKKDNLEDNLGKRKL